MTTHLTPQDSKVRRKTLLGKTRNSTTGEGMKRHLAKGECRQHLLQIHTWVHKMKETKFISVNPSHWASKIKPLLLTMVDLSLMNITSWKCWMAQIWCLKIWPILYQTTESHWSSKRTSYTSISNHWGSPSSHPWKRSFLRWTSTHLQMALTPTIKKWSILLELHQYLQIAKEQPTSMCSAKFMKIFRIKSL